MNKDQENLDSSRESRVPSEDSSSEDTEYSHEEDSSSESEQSVEPESEKLTDEESATKRKSYGKNGWLFLLLLIITIGLSTYFYSQEKEIDLPIALPSDLSRSFTFPAKGSKPTVAQSKVVPIEPAPKIIEQVEELSSSEKTISENEKTINILRNEIQSLKTALSQTNSIPSLQNVRNAIPHISGRTIREEAKEFIGKGGGKSESEIKISLIPSALVKAEPTFKQSQDPKTSPQRSKEVQAYLDFVEDTGNKFVRMIKEWSNHLLALVL